MRTSGSAQTPKGRNGPPGTSPAGQCVGTSASIPTGSHDSLQVMQLLRASRFTAEMIFTVPCVHCLHYLYAVYTVCSMHYCMSRTPLPVYTTVIACAWKVEVEASKRDSFQHGLHHCVTSIIAYLHHCYSLPPHPPSLSSRHSNVEIKTSLQPPTHPAPRPPSSATPAAASPLPP